MPKKEPPGGGGRGGSFLSVFAAMPSQQENYKISSFPMLSIQTVCAQSGLQYLQNQRQHEKEVQMCCKLPTMLFDVQLDSNC